MDRIVQNSETRNQHCLTGAAEANAESQAGGRVGQAGRSQKSEGRVQKVGAARPRVASGQFAVPSSRTMDEVTDAVARVLAGDVNAYEVIYHATDGPLRAFVGSRYQHLGQDFVEEVAVRTHEYAVKHLGRYDPTRGASFKTWLFWQSRNVAMKVATEWFSLRKVVIDGRWQRVSRSVAADDEKLEMLARAAPDPADVREAERDSLLIAKELEALEAKLKSGVVLHDIEGLTLDESALALGIPVSRLRRLLDQAHNRFRSRLKRLGFRPVERDSHYGMVRRDSDDVGLDDDPAG